VGGAQRLCSGHSLRRTISLVNTPREPHPLRGAYYHPGAGFHSFPPPKDRSPQRKVCPHCELPSETTLSNCPVCGTRYDPPLRKRLLRRFGRA
jgi:hypothetical protein